MAETEMELTLDQQHAQLVAKDWPGMAPVMGDDVELVDKLQRLCESFAEFLAYTGRLPDALAAQLAGLITTLEQAAQVSQTAALAAIEQQRAEGVTAVESARLEAQTVATAAQSAAAGSASASAVQLAQVQALAQQVQALTQAAQAAAAGEVIDNGAVSELTAWSSATTAENSRQDAVAMALVLG